MIIYQRGFHKYKTSVSQNTNQSTGPVKFREGPTFGVDLDERMDYI